MSGPRLLAFLLSISTFVVATTWSTKVAAGADSYGYIAQSDLWLKGDFRVHQPFALKVPWPNGPLSFTPLGFRPVDDQGDIVPTYSPGLPMAMAIAKAIGGHCAVFLVVPIAAGLLVWGTYAIGQRLDQPMAGLVGAWLVATSPTALTMAMVPMSDVPAAAAWTVSLALLLGTSRRSAVGAGAATAAAILIRPNLAPLAIGYTAWAVYSDIRRHRTNPDAVRRSWLFVTVAASGAFGVGAFYSVLYGSPFQSGYGDVGGMFSSERVVKNAAHYLSWMWSAEMPLTAFGFVGLARVWKSGGNQVPGVAALVTVSLVMLWALYLPYLVFGEWWYLRFLLPSWPILAVAGGTLLTAIAQTGPRWMTLVVIAAVFGSGVLGIRQGADRHTFEQAQGEWKYVEVARVVANMTPANAVVLSMQHSGTLRYYGGRLTLRWDYLDGDWIDRAVEWLQARGHHPYLLLEDWEIERIRSRSGTSSPVGRLDWPPIATFRDGYISLFDAAARHPDVRPIVVRETSRERRCVRPKPMPRVDW